jgi:hypothetical protein
MDNFLVSFNIRNMRKAAHAGLLCQNLPLTFPDAGGKRGTRRQKLLKMKRDGMAARRAFAADGAGWL